MLAYGRSLALYTPQGSESDARSAVDHLRITSPRYIDTTRSNHRLALQTMADLLLKQNERVALDLSPRIGREAQCHQPARQPAPASA